MALPKSLVSQFAKTVNKKDTNNKETFIQGTVSKVENGKCYVYVDDLNRSFPASLPTNVNKHQPVTIMIKNHTASIIGNVSQEINDSPDEDIYNSTSKNIDIESISYEEIEEIFNS